jgi:hypothetical protein
MTDLPAASAPAPGLEDDILPLNPITSIFDLFHTDRVAEEDGKWFANYFGDKAEGDIRLRGFSSKASMTVRRRLEAQYRHLLRADGQFPIEVIHKIMTAQIAEAIVVDWRGPIFTDRQGTALKCTPDVVLKLLTESPRLRDKIANTAGDMDAFRASNEGAAIKN